MGNENAKTSKISQVIHCHYILHEYQECQDSSLNSFHVRSCHVITNRCIGCSHLLMRKGNK